MNLFNYLSTISRLWNNEDGTGFARFISINGNHSRNSNLHVNNPDEAVGRMISSPIVGEVIVNHLKVISFLNCDRKLYFEVQVVEKF